MFARAKALAVIAAAGAAAAFMLMGCMGSPSEPSSSSGDVVTLDAEGVVMVPLDYSAGTGFEWKCELSGDADALVIVSEEDEDLEQGKPVTGGSLRHWVTLRASAPGSAVLTCSLERSWEEGSADTQVYAFTVDADLQIHFDAEHSTYTNEPEKAYNS